MFTCLFIHLLITMLFLLSISKSKYCLKYCPVLSIITLLILIVTYNIKYCNKYFNSKLVITNSFGTAESHQKMICGILPNNYIIYMHISFIIPVNVFRLAYIKITDKCKSYPSSLIPLMV